MANIPPAGRVQPNMRKAAKPMTAKAPSPAGNTALRQPALLGRQRIPAGGTYSSVTGDGLQAPPAPPPVPAAGIEGAIASLKGQLGQGGGGPGVAATNAPSGVATSVPTEGPATAAVKARLLPRLQAAVDAGTFTPEGAANRQKMFQAGQLPGQRLDTPAPDPAAPLDPMAQVAAQAAAQQGRGRLPIDQATGLSGGAAGGGLDYVTGGGLQAPGGGGRGGGFAALQPLPTSTYGAESPGAGGNGGMSYATGGGLQADAFSQAQNALNPGGGLNPGPDGRGGNYGAPTFAPQFQNQNFRQMYQDLLQARLQAAGGGASAMVGSPNLIQR